MEKYQIDLPSDWMLGVKCDIGGNEK